MISCVKALEEAYRAINITPVDEIGGIENRGGGEILKRRGGAKHRMWLSSDTSDTDESYILQPRAIDDNKVKTSILNLSCEKREVKIETPRWVELSASNTFQMNTTLQSNIISRDLAPYYSEYMEVQMAQTAGFESTDASFRCVIGPGPGREDGV